MSNQVVDTADSAIYDPGTYAAIDLGTNNCRLLIAQPTTDGFCVVDGYSKIVRLGEGLAVTNTLNADAMGRTLNALRACAGKINDRNVKHIRCVATEACRRADNGSEFLERVISETGLPFEIVTPELEAHLTLHGCTPLFTANKPRALLFDIGGGSTEIVWADTTAPQSPKLLNVLSFPMGVVTLTETYGKGLLKAAQFEKICNDITSILGPFCAQHEILQAITAGQVQMIGTSGTVTTLGALTLGLERYDRSQVDGLEISFSILKTLISDIINMDMHTRRKIPCIGPERADLMIMGCAILNAICKQWPLNALRAADRGIREGLLMEMIEKDRHNSPLSGPLSNTTSLTTYARR